MGRVPDQALRQTGAAPATRCTNPLRSPMKRLTVLPGLVLALVHSGGRAQTPPADWIDRATGHRVIRLSGDDGGSSLYFHQNAYTPKGDKFVFNTRAGIAAIDLTKLGKEPIK